MRHAIFGKFPPVARTRLRRSCENALVAAPPPVMHEVVDDFTELTDRATLAHEVARRRVERHHAVADAPAPLAFRIEPDDALHALAHQTQRPRLGIVVVVARVSE